MSIPPEAVEAAAKATFERMFEDLPDTHGYTYTWAEMVADDPTRAEIWRDEAQTALTAAMPAIRKEIARELREMDGEEWGNLRDWNDFPYPQESDSYNGTMVEFGVGCAEVGMEMAAQYIENGDEESQN